jgi:hypothetical protein
LTKPRDQQGVRGTVIIASHHKTGTAFAFSTVHALSKHRLFRDTHFQFGILGPPTTDPSSIATFYSNDARVSGTPGIEWLNTASARPLKEVLSNLPKRNRSNAAGKPTSSPMRFVHLVRDPVEMIVSAFLYHLQKPEDEMWWLTAPGLFEPSERVIASLAKAGCQPNPRHPWTWLEILECLPPGDGIIAEGWKMIRDDIEPMAAVCGQVDCGQTSAFMLDIDEVVRDFDGSMVRLVNFLSVTDKTDQRVLMAVLEQTQKRALSNNSHVTNGKFDKEHLRDVLNRDTEISARLGYLRGMIQCPLA